MPKRRPMRATQQPLATRPIAKRSLTGAAEDDAIDPVTGQRYSANNNYRKRQRILNRGNRRKSR